MRRYNDPIHEKNLYRVIARTVVACLVTPIFVPLGTAGSPVQEYEGSERLQIFRGMRGMTTDDLA